MKCNTCKHEEVCKYRSTFETYSNMLFLNFEDNNLYVECNSYNEVDELKQCNHYVVRREHRLLYTEENHMVNYKDESKFISDCKLLHLEGIKFVMYTYEIYSNGSVKAIKLPYSLRI